MDWARLVLEYLDVLAWPGVVGLAIWTLRNQLRGLVDRIRTASFGDARVEMAETRRELVETRVSVEAAANRVEAVVASAQLSGTGTLSATGRPGPPAP